MSTASTIQDLDGVLRQLAGKYSVDVPGAWRLAATAEAAPAGGVTLLPGWAAWDREPSEAILPLLPWRSERRFVELKRMVDDRTIEHLSTCRFSCMTDGQTMSLPAALYREFDLAEWIAGSPIVSVMASICAGRWANVVARLASGIACGVEVGTTLPIGTATLDRHELIARRGVACDRVVDSQVPQNSIYTFTASGAGQYTDVDAELFGLATDEVNLVRAAYELALHPDRADGLRSRHSRLSGLVRLAFESDRQGQRLNAEGGR
jgi:hypothetical protein